MQRGLLRAASYGKCFIDDAATLDAADKFVDTARIVRVLNALREPEVRVCVCRCACERV